MNVFPAKCARALFVWALPLTLSAFAQSDPAARLNRLFDPSFHEIFVAAHRGDWRDAPENSIESLQDAQRIGVDVVEIDLKKTRDGHLVLMHDQSVDRTSTGSGPVAAHSLEELEQLKLRAGTGHPTAHRIPTFEDELLAAKGRMILNVDQGWDYFPDVVKALRQTGTVEQAIVNARPNTKLSDFELQQGHVPDEVTLMVVVDMARPHAIDVIQSYAGHKRTVVQCIFAHDDIPAMRDVSRLREIGPIWINSLWPELSGGHDDDRAVEKKQPDEAWGWLVAHGVNAIQTDRPEQLLQYLRAKRLHEE